MLLSLCGLILIDKLLDYMFILKILDINKGITVFKIFIWGGMSSDKWSEIRFYGDMLAEP